MFRSIPIHPQPPPKSADTLQHLRTELSLGPSDLSQGSSGRETPRQFVASVMRRDVRTAERWLSGRDRRALHVWAVMFAITNPNGTLRQ
jgi:hypothetical protein